MIITLFTPCKVIQILEYNKFLLVESRVMGFGIPDSALGVQKPANNWNPESKFHWQGNSESSSLNVKSMAWNSEFKTVLDYLIRVNSFQTFFHEDNCKYHLPVSSVSASSHFLSHHRYCQHPWCNFPKSDWREDMLIPFLTSQQKTQGEETYPGTWAKGQQIPPELQLYP